MNKFNKKLCIIIAILLVTNIISLSFLLVNKDKEKDISENDFLNQIKVGHSEEYINSYLGLPESTDVFEIRDINKSYKKSGYKLDNVALFCIFDEGNLEAFCIIINENGSYQVKDSSLDAGLNLGSFTYNDYSEFYYKYSANVAASTLTASYYCEFYESNASRDYITFLLASYISFKEGENLILHKGNDSLFETKSEFKMNDELKEARKNSKPNVYGEISPEIDDYIDSPADFITKNATQIFFEKW